MEKKNILLAGDSLGLPRPDGAVMNPQTWPMRLQQAIPEFAFEKYFRGSLTMPQLQREKQYAYLGGFPADLLIVQVGIVDCAPRCFSPGEIQFFSTLGLSNWVRKLAKKHHAALSGKRDMSYVTREEFKQAAEKLRQAFSAIPVWCVPIAPANEAYRQHSPGISERIQSYNKILNTVFGDGYLGSVFDHFDAEMAFLPDHHHFNVDGHQSVADALIKIIQNRLPF